MPDWFPATSLMDPDQEILADALARQAADHPNMEARTRGSYFIGEYSWWLSVGPIAAYLTQQRVPDLSAGNIALRQSTYTWREGGESGEAERIDIRFISGRFACLPDDPDVDHPDAIVTPDKTHLRQWLRGKLEAHMAPIIERVHAHTNLSQYAQWCLVADAVAAQFLHIGKQLGDEEHGQTEGLAFVKAEDSPLNNKKTGYISLQYLDHRESFRTRAGCCRYYTVSETGKEYCSTCVLRKPEDRDARLVAYMKWKHEEAAS